MSAFPEGGPGPERWAGTTGKLATMLAGNDPIILVSYVYDDDDIDPLLDLCRMLAPADRVPVETHDVVDAFSAESAAKILALVLDDDIDEVEAVRALEGRIGQLTAREAPVVLFLRQRGLAEDVMHREAPELSGLLRGLLYDPQWDTQWGSTLADRKDAPVTSTPLSVLSVDILGDALDQLNVAAERLDRARLLPDAVDEALAAMRGAVQAGRAVVRAARGEDS